MSTVHWYFAYGSNMNRERVSRREMGFRRALGGTLSDFELRFNKRSTVHPGMASANVMRVPGARVEGVVYELSEPAQIEQMDPFEGFPERYVREPCAIVTDEGALTAWVYIATERWITEGLRPARWYLNHLLAGEVHLSRDYYTALAGTECLPGSEVEPVPR